MNIPAVVRFTDWGKPTPVYSAKDRPNSTNKHNSNFPVPAPAVAAPHPTPTLQNNSKWARDYRGEQPKYMVSKDNDVKIYIGRDVGRRERMLKWGY